MSARGGSDAFETATGIRTLADFGALSFVFLLQCSYACATRVCARCDIAASALRVMQHEKENRPRSDTAALLPPGAHREE